MLAIGLLEESDLLLQFMKQKVDAIIAVDEVLQRLLGWVAERASSFQASFQFPPYKPAAIRAFYLIIAYDFAIANNQKLDSTNAIEHFFDNSLIDSLDKNFSPGFAHQVRCFGDLLYKAHRCSRTRRYNTEFAIEIAKTNNDILLFFLNPEWQGILKKVIPNPSNKQIFDNWWQLYGQFWSEKFNIFFAQFPQTVHDFSLSSQQKKLFNDYYKANQFILECLNTDCYVNLETRQKIEDTLFLPLGEIEVLIG